MPFPEHIARVLEAYGIPADTKAALYDVYVSMGDEVLHVFADIAESVASPSKIRPEETGAIRDRLIERYLTRNHPRWLDGTPSASLWHPRLLEGRASGLAVPLGLFADVAPRDLDRIIDAGQPVPESILMLGRNAHYGGRQETISFDLVAASLPDAIALGQAAGQQHTLPGSAGQTSGTVDPSANAALIWEIQPNVYKPAGERNRSIARLYRRHRNWHLLTFASALDWLAGRGTEVHVLRGEALATTHEVNPSKPVSDGIVAMHNRTVAKVATALGYSLVPMDRDSSRALLEMNLMNHALRKAVANDELPAPFWRMERD